MRRNSRMIRDAMKSGRQIVDIGPDFEDRASGAREASRFYNMERRLTKGYDGCTRCLLEADGRKEGFPVLMTDADSRDVIVSFTRKSLSFLEEISDREVKIESIPWETVLAYTVDSI